jgi:acyl carrier protein phosphodiesterase
MNHLAHCFLSFDNEDVLIGNISGDFIKGNDWQQYPKGIQKGVLLHRTIDSFTDNHPMTDVSVSRIRLIAGRYAPPFVDILYDHLLAIHWAKYSDESFELFAEKTYGRLASRMDEMPEVLREKMPRMLAGKFLHVYQDQKGLSWVLEKFSQRLPGNFDAKALTTLFFNEIEGFSEDFLAFFPDLVAKTNEMRNAKF